MKLEELKKLCDEATPGPWDFEYGVSMRTAWKLESLEKHPNSYETVLWLDGGKNLDLDAETGRVEQNMEFIAAARDALPKLIAVAEAAKFIEDNKISWYMAYDSEALKQASSVLNQALAALEKL